MTQALSKSARVQAEDVTRDTLRGVPSGVSPSERQHWPLSAGSLGSQSSREARSEVGLLRHALILLLLPFALGRAVAREWAGGRIHRRNRLAVADDWTGGAAQFNVPGRRMASPPMDTLAQETTTFARLLPELRRSALGQFAVIDGSRLVGTYSSYGDALTAGYAACGLRAFLVEQIDDDVPDCGIQRLRFTRRVLAT